jgi:hypothetical protein
MQAREYAERLEFGAEVAAKAMNGGSSGSPAPAEKEPVTA